MCRLLAKCRCIVDRSLNRFSILIDLIDIEGDQIEVVFSRGVVADAIDNACTDGIVLKLQRAVNSAVLGVIRDTTEVTDEPVDRSDEISLKVGLDEKRREGIINISVFLVNGNSLTVTFAEVSRENLIWKFSHNSIRN